MRTRTAISVASVLIVLPAARVEAQSAFVGAGAGVAAIRFSHQSSESPTVSNNDISGNTSTWSFTAGTRITRRAVLQMEYGQTAKQTTVIPPPVFLNPCPSCGRTTTTVDYRSSHFGVLMGYTASPWQRFSISALGGVVLVGQTARSRAVFTPTPPSPPPLPSDNTFTAYMIGPEFGLDAAVALWRHLRVVPQARVYRLGSFTTFLGTSQTLVTTLAVDARWYF